MATVKSASVTNADASPYVRDSQGAGQPGEMKANDDYVTFAASALVGDIYRTVRVPTTAKVKRLIIESEAQGAGKVDVGLYYSTAVGDSPASAALAGAVVDQDFFATDVDLASAVIPTNITNESGTYTIGKRQMPLWQAVGLASDPGGYFDIAMTVHTTAITTGTGKTQLSVEFAR